MVRTTSTAIAMLALTACGGRDDSRSPDSFPADAANMSATARNAVATVRDVAGTELGVLSLSDQSGTISISGALRSLPPGTHGIHVHMAAPCEPPFESAGGHWNPAERQHGLENPAGPHRGDLPNIEVAGDSTVTVNVTTPEGNLGELLDLDGASVIIHAARDDQRTDPSGASGARIACGVIEAR
jgi:Cu-Zn family superoxide dismutase